MSKDHPAAKARLQTASTVVLCALVALSVVYVGGYYALVTRGLNHSEGSGFSVATTPLKVVPRYRIGGEAAEGFFYPMHWVDCQMRAKYWEGNGLLFWE
jgi:hypothetical protein